MLSIGKLGAGQERYYLDKVAEGAEDYYSGEGEAEGRWLGDAARELGLAGRVEADQLTAMLTGNDPATGEPLGLRAVGGRGAVPGFDLTFSVPKSASLLWALGDAETGAEIRAAVDSSLDAALGYLQREACWTRRGAGAEFVKGNGYLVAAFPHRSSRAGDPQLHVHALIANATQGPDGKWTRLHHPSIYEHAKAAGYLFEAHFRHELTRRLGVELAGGPQRHRRDRRLRGLPPARVLHPPQGDPRGDRPRRLGPLAPDRHPRHPQRQGGDRRRQPARALGEKAEEIGLTPKAIARVADREGAQAAIAAERRGAWRSGSPASTAPWRSAVSTARSQRRPSCRPRPSLPARSPPTPPTSTAARWSRPSRSSPPAAPLPRRSRRPADAFLASPQVVRIAEAQDARGERFTTGRIWELERRALASAEAMAAQGDRALADERIAANVIALRPSLKARPARDGHAACSPAARGWSS